MFYQQQMQINNAQYKLGEWYDKPYILQNNRILRFCYDIKHIKFACGILFGNCSTQISACGTKLFH